jgi:hypothetical protein
MIKNTAGQAISAALVNVSDGSAVTTGTTLVYVTIDGGTQTLGTGTVEHEGNGQWSYFPTQTETNGDMLAFLFVNALAIIVNLDVITTPAAGTVTAPVPGTGVAPTLLVTDFLSTALTLIGAYASEETPRAADSVRAMAALNRMISMWNTDRLFIYTVKQAIHNFTANQQSYQMGPGAADFPLIERPVKIVNCNLIMTNVTPNLRLPMNLLNDDQWASKKLLNLATAIPTDLYNDGAYPYSTLYFWPKPLIAYQFELYTWQALYQVADLFDPLILPPGYEEAVLYNLAIRLAIEFQRPVGMDLREQAREAKMLIQSLNAPAPILTPDSGGFQNGGISTWNPYTGGM